ncbi:hypothetical protein [Mesorhizobium caraganae]|uniref:hypothetical protein n=1 Tax=Mesorhizobium caraganae TaxID=483206 RepID=UPI00177AB338|nr:hypothetical protein [Mesorhizobium caraganae]
MAAEEAAPCRHRGAPPEEVVARVAEIIEAISNDADYLYRRGISAEEFDLALPVAIEKIRGSRSASSGDRKDFLLQMFSHMQSTGAISSFLAPKYGDDTVYRLTVPELGDVAVVQKGCPDGKHSSVAWSVPEWAVETYLWWVCPSLKGDPGWHVSAGVKRLRGEFFSTRPDALDGVIFHGSLCGSDLRPCPKKARSVRIGDADVPPPCVWIMPERGSGPEYNWTATRQRRFPAVLLSSFGISAAESPLFTGNVGFRAGAREGTIITSRFGSGCSTSSRS